MSVDSIAQNDWLPDWRNLSEYERRIPRWVHPGEMNRVFAWQFLRRNSTYQYFYNQIRTEAEEVDIFLENKKHGVSSNHTIGNYGYCQRSGIVLYPRGNTDSNFKEKLLEIMNPFCMVAVLAAPSCDDFIMPSIDTICGYGPDKFKKEIVVDVRFPIQPQLDRAAQILRDVQKDIQEYEDIIITRPTHKNRHHKALLRYLRILDAYKSGATPLEIIEVFYPSESRYTYTPRGDKKRAYSKGKGTYSPADKRWRDDLKEAELLCERDWLTLLD